jgi:hypothetical protein
MFNNDYVIYYFIGSAYANEGYCPYPSNHFSTAFNDTKESFSK